MNPPKKSLSQNEIRRKRIAALQGKSPAPADDSPEPTIPPPPPPTKAKKAAAASKKLSPIKMRALEIARQTIENFDEKERAEKKQILKRILAQLKGNKKGNNKKENKKKGNKKKVNKVNNVNQQELNKMVALQIAREEQERQNAMYAIEQQQGEFQHLDEWANEQKARELQAQFNREQAQAIANVANIENQQPRLGCRPDSTNAACIGSGAAVGAAVGSVVPVLGTGVGACVGAACGLGAAVRRRFRGQGRKSRKKRGRKHKRKTRKHHKKRRTKRRKNNRKKRTKRRR